MRANRQTAATHVTPVYKASRVTALDGRRLIFWTIGLVVCLCGAAARQVWADGESAPVADAAEVATPVIPVPSADEVDRMLNEEPFSLATWPVWRARLLGWIDAKSDNTNAAYEAARQFMLAEAGDDDVLEGPLEDDAVAWYVLGSAQVRNVADRPSAIRQAELAEKSLTRSIALDPESARAHRYLALALLLQSRAADDAYEQRANEYLKEARRLDPDLPLKWVPASAALVAERYQEAVPLWRAALEEEPEEVQYATTLARTLLSAWNEGAPAPTAEIAGLSATFPDDGTLCCFLGLTHAMDNEFKPAVEQFERARALGVDPNDVLNPEMVTKIEQLAAPSPAWMLLYGAGIFSGVYGVIMLAMVAAAFVLSLFTRGVEASRLASGESLLDANTGQIGRTSGESLLAQLYAALLAFGLVMFYVAIPFVIVGLIALTGGLLYLIILMGRIPIKLFLVILIVGLAMVWAVIKSIFAKSGDAGFGIRKTRLQEPALHQVLADVAGHVHTKPVDQVYISPGSEIGVHQTGRGPFGIFGVKSRTLTLGLASLQTLTVDELKSILAHEYAHFSHGDTFFGRFIYQVQLSIGESLRGMGEAGGRLNYVNPFFWFMYLYYKAYSMMASGFSRSREFLADRMAVTLYGGNVFKMALTKVATRGTYNESLVYGNLVKSLEAGQPRSNLFDDARAHERENPEDADRDKMFADVMHQKGSLFASHPTITERFAAVAAFPTPRADAGTPAISLLSDHEAIERELTEFLGQMFQPAMEPAQ